MIGDSSVWLLLEMWRGNAFKIGSFSRWEKWCHGSWCSWLVLADFTCQDDGDGGEISVTLSWGRFRGRLFSLLDVFKAEFSLDWNNTKSSRRMLLASLSSLVPCMVTFFASGMQWDGNAPSKPPPPPSLPHRRFDILTMTPSNDVRMQNAQ